VHPVDQTSSLLQSKSVSSNQTVLKDGDADKRNPAATAAFNADGMVGIAMQRSC
jgi:hypothetical protein